MEEMKEKEQSMQKEIEQLTKRLEEEQKRMAEAQVGTNYHFKYRLGIVRHSR